MERLWEALDQTPGAKLTVSLEDRTVSIGDLTVPFQIDDDTRWRLLEGLDDVGLTERHLDDIEAFEATRPSWKPTALPAR